MLRTNQPWSISVCIHAATAQHLRNALFSIGWGDSADLSFWRNVRYTFTSKGYMCSDRLCWEVAGIRKTHLRQTFEKI